MASVTKNAVICKLLRQKNGDKMKARTPVLLLASLLIAQTSQALTPSAMKLINFETKANAVSVRSNQALSMPHYEIPLDMLDINFANRFSANIKKHLIFERDGKKYVRWILNPEDTKWSDEIVAYFEKKGIKLEKKYYFKGYQTASRSYIVEDPNGEMQISVKSSTNKTGGYWADKKQPVGEAEDSRLNADLLADVQEKLRFENIVVMDEPAVMKLPNIDQAVVFRDLADLNNSEAGKIYVPGFSVLHETMGREIAERNGSKDPYSFWTEHYVKAVGRALGELAARTGLQFDSPHSQNFLVELDANYKPTGRIVLRDLADLYLYKDFTKVLHPNADNYLERFSQKGNVLNSVAAGFGPLHGNEAPSWINNADYAKWKNVFFEQFEKTFANVSGMPVESFKSGSGSMNGRYFGNEYRISKDGNVTTEFWKNIRKYQSPRGILNCSYVLQIK